MLAALLDTLIPRIPERHGFLAMQQRLRLADVADMTRCANTLREVATSDGMHQTGVRVHPNVRLHAEVPLVAASALVHVGVAFARFIFGRGWCGN